jgi:hypothetical protein
MTATLFPWLRAAHILFAALWFGAAAFLTLYLLPAARQLGPAAEPAMRAITRRGFHRFMAASSGLAVASGLWLYWLLTAGLKPVAIHSATGMTYGVGGLAGLLAAALGGAVIGRSLTRIDRLAGAGRDAEIAVLQRRVAIASRTALALLLVALLAMTLGHVA